MFSLESSYQKNTEKRVTQHRKSDKYGFTTFLFLFILTIAGNSLADGFIVIPRPHPLSHPFPLQVEYHNVNVEINEQSVITKIDQAFYNPSPHRLEGYYIFPIPKGAVINNFTMVINGRETRAELLDAGKARMIYEDIVRQMRDPALLEYSTQDIFKLRIFPIEPKSEKKISITYSQVIEADNNLFEYIYPLNTEKFSAEPLKNVSIKVDLHSNEKIKNIYSPTHEVEVVNKSDYHSLISYEKENIKPDEDFKLYFTKNSSTVGISVITCKDENEDGYFLFSASPSIDSDKTKIEDKDITFVVDVSGSMNGEKLEQAKKALLYCINNLNTNDNFEIIKFSTEASALFKELKPADKINRNKAKKFVEDFQAIGGTNIGEAFQLALKNGRESSRPHFIIFLTDGKPTIGETDNEKLLKKVISLNPEGIRIFTFGIGNEINTHLLDKITEETNAYRTYIGEEEDIEIKVSNFYDKIQSPVLTSLKLDFGDGIDVYQYYPKNLPDLFKGSNLIVFGRYNGKGKSNIILSGNIKGERKHYFSEVNFADNNDYSFIPPLWASRRIGYLLDIIRLNGEDKELIDEITILARKHGIITPYTSYLILEDEENRRRRNILADDFQTLPSLPEIISGTAQDFSAMKMQSGRASVIVSEELQNLNEATNSAQTQQGSKRLDYKDSEGKTKNLAQQVRNIQGRAVYQQENFWVDSDLQKQSGVKKVKIKFNSDEYFDLLNKEPETRHFIALGQNVRFLYKNTYYEVSTQ